MMPTLERTPARIDTDPEYRAKIEASFWPRVQRGDENSCWPWILRAGEQPERYGYFCMEFQGQRTTMSAARVSCWLTYGPPIKGHVARHHCDNPPCVNPTHLAWGRVKDNAMDASAARVGKIRQNRMGPWSGRTASELWWRALRSGWKVGALMDFLCVSDRTPMTWEARPDCVPNRGKSERLTALKERLDRAERRKGATK